MFLLVVVHPTISIIACTRLYYNLLSAVRNCCIPGQGVALCAPHTGSGRLLRRLFHPCQAFRALFLTATHLNLILLRINKAYYLPQWCSTADYVSFFQEEGLADIKRADWSENVQVSRSGNCQLIRYLPREVNSTDRHFTVEMRLLIIGSAPTCQGIDTVRPSRIGPLRLLRQGDIYPLVR